MSAPAVAINNTFYNNCRYELLRVIFELECTVNAKNPIYVAILTSKLLKTWGMSNVKLVAGYFHDSNLGRNLVPYAWVTSEDEDGVEVVTDLTHAPPKPYRLMGVELSLGHAETADELLSADKVTEKDDRIFRFLTTVPPGFRALNNPGAPDCAEIEKWLNKPTEFLARCGKSYAKAFDDVLAKHITPLEAQEDVALQVPASMIESLKNFGKK